MRKELVLGFVAASMTMQLATLAHAETPLPPPVPGPSQQIQEGTIEVQRITRKAGGEWYRISLRKAVTLARIELMALSMKIKIHEGSVITTNGDRIAIREFANVAVTDAGVAIASENLNINDRITAIDIRAESYGGYADIRVLAVSTEERPQLVLGNAKPEKPPAPKPPAPPAPQPPPPPVPQPPSRPDRPQRPDRPGRPDRPQRPPQNPGNGCYQRADVSYEISRVENDMVIWAIRIAQSVYGTNEYNFAVSEIGRSADYIVSVANSYDARNTPVRNLEAVGSSLLNRVDQYTYGTPAYEAFSKTGTAVMTALGAALDTAIYCDFRDTADLLQEGISYLQKMDRATYGTVKYNAYSNAATKLFAVAPGYYEQQVYAARWGFREINADVEAFHQKRESYTYGTQGYTAFGAMTTKAISLAQNDLRQRVAYMTPNERYDWMNFFEGRKNRFTYGTLPYDHYATMKDIMLNGR